MIFDAYSTELGIIAGIIGVIMSLSYFPQAYKMWVNRSAKNVSLLTFSILFAGFFVWFIYGIALNNYALMAAYGVAILSVGSVLIAYMHHK